MSTIPGLENAPTRNKKLLAWVEEIAALTQPDRVEWCDGSQAEWDRLTQLLVDGGTFTRLNERSAPTPSSPAPTRATSPASRTAPSSAREHEEDAGPTNNWRDPAEMRADARRACSPAACAAARCTSCRSRMGPLGSPITPARRRDHRLAVRRRHHADHDPHGQGRPRPARRGRRLRARPCTRSARRSTPGQADVAVAVQRRPSTSSTSPRPARSGPTARATAATPCSARSASRCASPR